MSGICMYFHRQERNKNKTYIELKALSDELERIVQGIDSGELDQWKGLLLRAPWMTVVSIPGDSAQQVAVLLVHRADMRRLMFV